MIRLYLFIYTFLSLNEIMGMDYSPFPPTHSFHSSCHVGTGWAEMDRLTEREAIIGSHQGLDLSVQPLSLYSDYPCLFP